MGVKDDIARARAEFSQAKTQHTQRKQPGFELVPTSKRAAARSEHSVSAAGKANTTQLRCGLALLRCVAVSCAVASLASLTMVALGLDVGDELRAVRSRLHMDAALEQQLHCDRTLDTVAGRLDLRRQGEATGLCAPHAHSRTRARAVGSGSGSSALSFLVLGDFGRDGMCCQRDVALEMALAAKATKPQLVLNLGDAIYSYGLWTAATIEANNATNAARDYPAPRGIYERFGGAAWQVNTSWADVYLAPHPELRLPWWGVLGNHEYRGLVSEMLRIPQTQPLWKMPGLYYDHLEQLPAGACGEGGDQDCAIHFVHLDTEPLIPHEYRTERWSTGKFEAGHRTLDAKSAKHSVYRSLAMRSPDGIRQHGARSKAQLKAQLEGWRRPPLAAASKAARELIEENDSLNFEGPVREQMVWLNRTLAESTARWKVVIAHHPIYSSGIHHMQDFEPAWGHGTLHHYVQPLLRVHGVHVYFSGHDHHAEHLHDKQYDIHFFIAGHGSKVRYGEKKNRDHSHSVWRQFSEQGFVHASASADELLVQYLDFEGKEAYSFTVKRSRT